MEDNTKKLTEVQMLRIANEARMKAAAEVMAEYQAKVNRVWSAPPTPQPAHDPDVELASIPLANPKGADALMRREKEAFESTAGKAESSGRAMKSSLVRYHTASDATRKNSKECGAPIYRKPALYPKSDPTFHDPDTGKQVSNCPKCGKPILDTALRAPREKE